MITTLVRVSKAEIDRRVGTVHNATGAGREASRMFVENHAPARINVSMSVGEAQILVDRLSKAEAYCFAPTTGQLTMLQLLAKDLKEAIRNRP